jgi:hypothetical protein
LKGIWHDKVFVDRTYDAFVPNQYDFPATIVFSATTVYFAMYGYAAEVCRVPFVHVPSATMSVGGVAGIVWAKICKEGAIFGRAKIGVSERKAVLGWASTEPRYFLVRSSTA